MADAIPVNSQEPEVIPEAPKKASKKGASAGIPEDVMADLKEQVKEELRAEQSQAVKAVDEVPNPFKVEGGKELESHKAVRQDF